MPPPTNARPRAAGAAAEHGAGLFLWTLRLSSRVWRTKRRVANDGTARLGAWRRLVRCAGGAQPTTPPPGAHPAALAPRQAARYHAPMSNAPAPPRRDRSLGPLESTVARFFTRSASVCEVRSVSENFRLLTLAGQSLRGAAWVPGQKVQLLLGGWVQRTYTPLAWDAANGTTQLLAYVHG